MNRRGLLGALLAAPVLIRTPGLLMPVRPLPAASFDLLVSVHFDGIVLRMPFLDFHKAYMER